MAHSHSKGVPFPIPVGPYGLTGDAPGEALGALMGADRDGCEPCLLLIAELVALDPRLSTWLFELIAAGMRKHIGGIPDVYLEPDDPRGTAMPSRLRSFLRLLVEIYEVEGIDADTPGSRTGLFRMVEEIPAEEMPALVVCAADWITGMVDRSRSDATVAVLREAQKWDPPE